MLRLLLLLICLATPGTLTSCGPVESVFPDNDGGDGIDDGTEPRAVLTATNVTPQVDEEVTLTCRVQNGETPVERFLFFPTASPLLVDQLAGRASFVVRESDLGQTYTFSCTALLEDGGSLESNEVVISPSAPPPPDAVTDGGA